MKEHKHQSDGEERKIHQAEGQPEQTPTLDAAKAVQRVANGRSRPSDALAIQRSLGNTTTTNVVQRHPRNVLDTYAFWVSGNTSGGVEDGYWMRVRSRGPAEGARES